ncbi:HNH endonuclease signature motif containing protein [Fimbriiglobus ruber]|uniref:HNH endonuclease signature motif containing protein n=1 Tax=Fimbriiglobus ruber TaxID=1908690 RepID=UPI000B4B847E
MPSGVYSRRKAAPIIRFFAKVQLSPFGCWVWAGCRMSDGYGQFWDGNTRVLAHRWSYQHHVKPIAENFVIDHLCRNPSCVNPAHLDCVPMRVNTERGLLYETLTANAKKKTHCKRGHQLFGANLAVDRKGNRCCKACRNMKAEEWRRANRARVNLLQQIRRRNQQPQQGDKL